MRRDQAGKPAQGVRETRRYTNPVTREYFADPFVWAHEGTYYAVGTGAQEAMGEVHGVQPGPHPKGEEQPRVFSLLRSDDFVTWRQVGKALIRPDPHLGHSFWAPEVAYHEGSHY